MEPKQTKGRQKIAMKMIDDEEDRLISFSKRRSGIYKKASELSTLCGTEIAIIVFSPSGKAFSYGNPCLESVLNRFMNKDNPGGTDTTGHLVESHRRARIHELSQQYNNVLGQLEAGKKYAEALKRKAKSSKSVPEWWEVPVEEMSEPDVKRLESMVDDLTKKVAGCMINKRMEADTAAAAAAAALSEQQQHQIQIGQQSFMQAGQFPFGLPIENSNAAAGGRGGYMNSDAADQPSSSSTGGGTNHVQRGYGYRTGFY